jgi:phage FluMu protein Com
VKEIRCDFCKHFLLRGEFEGKLEINCRRCKSKNVVRSLDGGHVVTVTIDRKGDTRENNLPLPTRAVVQ